MYDQVVALYEKAISNIHAKNLILYLAFADFEEEQMRNTSAHEIYKKFLSQEDVDPSLVYGVIHIPRGLFLGIFIPILSMWFMDAPYAKMHLIISFTSNNCRTDNSLFPKYLCRLTDFKSSEIYFIFFR